MSGVRRSLSVLAVVALSCGVAAQGVAVPGAMSQSAAGGVMAAPVVAAPVSGAFSAKSMVPTPLTRVVDSRAQVGVTNALRDDQKVDVQIAGEVETVAGSVKSRRTVVPVGADAVVLNLTAVDAAADGFFTVWKKGDARPETSNINFAKGGIRANGATVPLSDSGMISVFARGGADVLVDVAGYYRDGSYTSMTPERLVDTRTLGLGRVPGGSVRRVKASDGAGDLVTLNVTVDRPGGPGFVTVWPTADRDVSEGFVGSKEGMPPTSNLNYVEGQTVANTVQLVTGTGGFVSVYVHGDTHVVVDKVHEVGSESAFGLMKSLVPAKRVMDTRAGLGSSAREGIRALDMVGVVGDVEVGSVVVNVTVVNPDGAGFVSLGRDLRRGGVSTSVLNYGAGETVANRVVIPVSFAGALEVFSSSPTDVVVDVMGYTVAPDVTPDPVVVDAGQLTGLSVMSSRANGLVGLSAGSAIAFPVEPLEGSGNELFVDDGLSPEAEVWNVRGREVVVRGPEGFEKEIRLVDFRAADGGVSHRLMPLAGLPVGDYSFSVLLRSDTDFRESGYYTGLFSVAEGDGARGATLASTMTSVVTATGTLADSGTVISVDGIEVAVPFAAADGVDGYATNAHNALTAALSNRGYRVTHSGAEVSVTKDGATAPIVEFQAGTSGLSWGPKLTEKVLVVSVNDGAAQGAESAISIGGVAGTVVLKDGEDKASQVADAISDKEEWSQMGVVVDSEDGRVVIRGRDGEVPTASVEVGGAVQKVETAEVSVATTANTVDTDATPDNQSLPLAQPADSVGKLYDFGLSGRELEQRQAVKVKVPEGYGNAGVLAYRWMAGNTEVLKASATIKDGHIAVPAPKREYFQAAKLPMTDFLTLEVVDANNNDLTKANRVNTIRMPAWVR